MVRKALLVVAFVAAASSAVQAQDHRVELSGTAGWTFSDGVTGASGGFVRVDPKDAFSWGARIGFMLGDNIEIGGLFNLQSTKLELGGDSQSVDIADDKVYNYHGYIAYNFGDPAAHVRPYFLGGAGATQYGGITTNFGGVQRELGGNTLFSTTWALGVKVFPGGNNFGLRFEGRWTPTYIKSDSEGWWCDPYWGCYVVANAQYSNQWELSGGLTLRF